MKPIATANYDFKGVVSRALLLAATLLLLPAAADWEQPRTTRRYLHPPMVDCMYTFWNDGKIMRGENRHRNALMKYSITTEYYVGERYRDDTPWYYPWSPNASGSGRIIQMMLRNP